MKMFGKIDSLESLKGVLLYYKLKGLKKIPCRTLT